jgi:hypothetical protein
MGTEANQAWRVGGVITVNGQPRLLSERLDTLLAQNPKVRDNCYCVGLEHQSSLIINSRRRKRSR